MPPLDRYVCPDCGDRSPTQTDCPRCEAPMLDAHAVPAWQHSRHALPAMTLRDSAWTTGLVLLALALTGGAVAWQLRLPVGSPLWFALAFTLAASLLGAFVGGAAIDARRIRSRRRREGLARAEATPAIKSSDAQEGQRVRLTGRVRPLVLARHPEGAPCLAYERAKFVALERRSDGAFGPHAMLYSGGGEFELDDGSGVRAVVRAEHVLIVGGSWREGELMVPTDAVLEVVGDAEWVAADDAPSLANAGPRSAARVLRVRGTDAEPVLLRVVEAPAPKRAATGVRVAASEPTVGAPAQQEESPREESAAKARRVP